MNFSIDIEGYILEVARIGAGTVTPPHPAHNCQRAIENKTYISLLLVCLFHCLRLSISSLWNPPLETALVKGRPCTVTPKAFRWAQRREVLIPCIGQRLQVPFWEVLHLPLRFSSVRITPKLLRGSGQEEEPSTHLFTTFKRNNVDPSCLLGLCTCACHSKIQLQRRLMENLLKPTGPPPAIQSGLFACSRCVKPQAFDVQLEHLAVQSASKTMSNKNV